MEAAVVFAIGFYVGLPVAILLVVLCIPAKTRLFAAPVLIIGALGGVLGSFMEWGMPWYVGGSFMFTVLAIPAALVSFTVAFLILGISSMSKDAA